MKIVVVITTADAAHSRLGRYRVLERRSDGTLLLAPESVDDVIAETADRPLTGEEFLEALDRLTTAAAQKPGA